MVKWIRKEKLSLDLPGFFQAIIMDIKDKVMRFRYKESIFRNFPGALGLWLRYHFLMRNFKSIGKDVLLWPGLRIKHPDKMEIGNKVQLGFDNHYQASAGIKIGDNTIIGPNVNIWTMNHVYTDLKIPIVEQGLEKKAVEIGKNCWITTRCFILPGAKIPDGCVIFPNTVVGIMNIPKDSLVGGNPARVLGNRKTLGKFKKY